MEEKNITKEFMCKIKGGIFLRKVVRKLIQRAYNKVLSDFKLISDVLF